jgi:hypothetical protein
MKDVMMTKTISLAAVAVVGSVMAACGSAPPPSDDSTPAVGTAEEALINCPAHRPPPVECGLVVCNKQDGEWEDKPKPAGVPCGDGGFCDGNFNCIATPPPVVPEVLFEFRSPSPFTGQCLPQTIQDKLQAGIKGMYGNADVHIACNAALTKVGVWLNPKQGRDNDAARDLGLTKVTAIGAAEQFAILLPGQTIRRQAAKAWDIQDKQFDENGSPSATGTIHLTSGFNPTLRSSPPQFVATVKGYDDHATPRANFTLTSTDTFSLSQGQITCTNDRKLDVDTSIFYFLAALTVKVIPLSGFFLAEGILGDTAPTPSTDAGGFCKTASLAFAPELMIPAFDYGGVHFVKKAAFNYTRVEASDTLGVVGAGTFALVDRHPSVTISGPSTRSVPVDKLGPVGVTYKAMTHDLRPPLSLQWTSSDGPVSATGSSAVATFTVPDSATVGMHYPRSVALSIRDADGLTASSTASTSIVIVKGKDDSGCNRPGAPPWCQIP